MARRGESEGGLRNWMNENPLLVAVPIVLLVIAALWFSLRGVFAGKAILSSQFYSADDGKTFEIKPFQLAPFEEGGKTWVQARVYTCDGGATRIVGYLLRYTDKGRAAMSKIIESEAGLTSLGRMPADWTEVKLPGGEAWVSEAPITEMASIVQGQKDAKAVIASGAGYREITAVKCPDGNTQPLEVGTATE